MESPTLPASSRPAAGPQDLTTGELGRYGLGVVVRQLRLVDAAALQPLSRVYCLGCGRAVEHESRVQGWWFCLNACNTETSH